MQNPLNDSEMDENPPDGTISSTGSASHGPGLCEVFAGTLAIGGSSPMMMEYEGVLDLDGAPAETDISRSEMSTLVGKRSKRRRRRLEIGWLEPRFAPLDWRRKSRE